VLKSERGDVVARVREGLGHDTNNGAEYKAMNRGMRTALEMGYDQIHIKGDSQLVHKQVQGEWQTRNENMSRYCNESRELRSQFKSSDMEHVPRGYNIDADAEANKAVNLPAGHVDFEDLDVGDPPSPGALEWAAEQVERMENSPPYLSGRYPEV